MTASRYRIGEGIAAAKWLILAILSFTLPFILGQTWGLLNSLWMLALIAWALVQAGLCMTMGIRHLMRADPIFARTPDDR